MKKLSFLLLIATACRLMADTVIIPSTAYTRSVLRSTNSTQAQVALGFNGTNIIGQLIMSNIASSAKVDRLVREYDLRDFGAFGDAQFVSGVLALSNSPNITVTYGNFTSGDIGKTIGIYGAGPNRRTWWTGISNVTDTTHITVSNEVSMSYNSPMSGNVQTFAFGTFAVYGAHDDSAAIQGWMNQITNGSGNFRAHPGVYLILNPPQNTNLQNAQIIVPAPARYLAASNLSYNAKPVMNIMGDSAFEPAFSDTPGFFSPPPNTTWFVSNLQGNNWTWTNLFGASVIDFRDYAFPDGHSSGHNNVYLWPANLIHPIFQNINLLCGYDCDAVGLNLIACFESEASRLNVIGGGFYPAYCPPPLGTNGWGVVMPGSFNGVAGDFRNVQIEEFMNGLDMGLIKGDYITFVACSNALTSQFSGGASEARIQAAQFTDCPIWLIGSGLNFDGTGGSPAGGTRPMIDVINWQAQILPGSTPDWQTNVIGFYDPSNQFLGGVITVGQSADGAPLPGAVRGLPSVGQGQRLVINYRHQGLLQTNITTDPEWHLNTGNIFNGVFNGQAPFLNQFSTFSYAFTNIPVFDGSGFSASVGFVLHNTGPQSVFYVGNENNTEWVLGAQASQDDPGGTGGSVPSWTFVPKVPGGGSILPGSYDFAFTIKTNGNSIARNNMTAWGFLIGGLIVSNSMSVDKTDVAPVNASTPKLWITITNQGSAYRVPLYQ